jgi:hypothetical protein
MSAKAARKPPPPPPSAIQIGSPIVAKCAKCKSVTPHLVVGKIGWRPTRVECCTCATVHEFRPPRVVKNKTEAASPTATPEEVWRSGMKRAKGNARPYDQSMHYAIGNRVEHASFGPGVVIRMSSETVCEVAFESGTVKLRMGARG